MGSGLDSMLFITKCIRKEDSQWWIYIDTCVCATRHWSQYTTFQVENEVEKAQKFGYMIVCSLARRLRSSDSKFLIAAVWYAMVNKTYTIQTNNARSWRESQKKKVFRLAHKRRVWKATGIQLTCLSLGPDYVSVAHLTRSLKWTERRNSRPLFSC